MSLTLATKGVIASHTVLALATKGVIAWAWAEEAVIIPGVIRERLPRQILPRIDAERNERWIGEFKHVLSQTRAGEQIIDLQIPRGTPKRCLPRSGLQGNETWLANFKNAVNKARNRGRN
jgi:hypothetical protein